MRSGCELADRCSLSIEDVDVERSVNGDRAGSYQPGVASADLRLHGGGSRWKDIDGCRLRIRYVEKVVAVNGQAALVGDGAPRFDAAGGAGLKNLDGVSGRKERGNVKVAGTVKRHAVRLIGLTEARNLRQDTAGQPERFGADLAARVKVAVRNRDALV